MAAPQAHGDRKMNEGDKVTLVKTHHLMSPPLIKHQGETGTIIKISEYSGKTSALVQFPKSDSYDGRYWIRMDKNYLAPAPTETD